MASDTPIGRLETWSHGHKARSVSIFSPDSYGAGCWTVTLGHERGVTVAEEAQFWTCSDENGGEAEYRRLAREHGVVFAECPEDTDWAGLDRTIEAALTAFDAGVWGPRTERHDIPNAQPIRKHTDAAFLSGAKAMQERAAETFAASGIPNVPLVTFGDETQRRIRAIDPTTLPRPA